MLVSLTILFYQYQGMHKNHTKVPTTTEMHDGKCQCHWAASCAYHLPTSSYSTRATQNGLTLYKIYWRKKSGTWTISTTKQKGGNKKQRKTKGKTERATGLGWKTRQEIGKWNEMTALGFQTGHQTPTASLSGFTYKQRSSRESAYL